MRKRLIKIVILVAVFILAIIVFSSMTNQEGMDLTADMDSATLPTISFETGNWQVNRLVGHKDKMDMVMMRDNLLPCETNNLSGEIQFYDGNVESMKYELYSMDGTEQLLEGNVESFEEGFSIALGDALESGKEAVLLITLGLGNEQSAYYYTRVVKEQEFYLMENLHYAMGLHDAIAAKKESSALKRGLESDGSGGSTLQHVTIHSDMKQVLWGDLEPEIINDVTIEIKEANASYVALQLSYRVACAGDNNPEEIYNVKEFYKVCYRKGNHYLLAYDRTMTEVFNPHNVALSGRGVILGMASEDTPYKANSEGTIVAFVQENELWSYDKGEDSFSLVFSFMDSEKEDVRNYYDQHGIRILSMEENGNMTFSVAGYMNRGKHEGESGLVIYYYNAGTNSIEEKAFIKSDASLQMIEKELNQLAYYNAKQDVLYILVEGDLYKVNLADGTKNTIVEHLQQSQYVTSESGNMIAYQTADALAQAEVWNFATDNHQTVKVQEDEILIPLGFVGEDFVYGVSSEKYLGINSSGEEVLAMSRVEICNAKNEVLKTYQVKDVFILGASIEGNMITLERGVKDGKEYDEIAEDYITNNEGSSNNQISLKSYWTELKGTQYRLLFSNTISDTKAKVLKPKHTLYESVLIFESGKTETKYYAVYGRGEQAGLYLNPGEAIQLAGELSGVVVSPKQNYVWEDGNRVAWYRNFNLRRFTPQSGESTLAACVRKVAEYEGIKLDAMTALQSKAPEDVLAEALGKEGIRFSDCSVKDMFYLIDKGVPVIALKDSDSAVLLIGYDALTVTYVEPERGAILSSSIEKMNKMVAGSGATFIGYVR